MAFWRCNGILNCTTKLSTESVPENNTKQNKHTQRITTSVFFRIVKVMQGVYILTTWYWPTWSDVTHSFSAFSDEKKLLLSVFNVIIIQCCLCTSVCMLNSWYFLVDCVCVVMLTLCSMHDNYNVHDDDLLFALKFHLPPVRLTYLCLMYISS